MIITMARNRCLEGVRLTLALSKPPVTLLLVCTALVAAVVAGRGMVTPAQLILLALAGTLSCAGAAWVNHYLDQDIDAVMLRTRNRPLPGRRVNGIAVAAVGIALIATGIRVGLLLNLTVATCVFLGAFVYTVVYTFWLKRRTAWNIVVGGAAGSFAVLAGWATVQPEFSPAAWGLAALLFLWTPPHFWSFAIVYAEDYRRAGVPMLPTLIGAPQSAWVILLHTLAVIGASVVPVLVGATPGWIYRTVAIGAGAYFLVASLRLVLQPDPRRAWKNYKASSLYLGLLWLGLLLEVLSPALRRL